MTGRPAAFSALAFASTASVADSEMADTRADILLVGMHPWCHLPAGGLQLVSSRAAPLVRFDGRGAFDVHSGDCNPEGSSSIGRVPVSKTGGWGFESLLPCQCRSAGPRGSAGLRVAIRLVLHR